MSTLKRILALALALVMAMSVMSFASFVDIDEANEDLVDAINMLRALELMVGYELEDGSYEVQPNSLITRREVCAMLYRLLNGGVDDKAEAYSSITAFSDVPAGVWYAGYVNACYSYGLVNGYGDGTFRPDAYVTGAEMAKMLLALANYDISIQGYVGSNWAANVQRDFLRSGMNKGYGVSLTSHASRQWVALMFYNTILYVEMAEYLGSSLITGTSLVNAASVRTVGQFYMNMVKVTGNLYQTHTAQINNTGTGGGADSYAANRVYVNQVNGVNAVSANVDFVLEGVSNELLGQEVTVIGFAKNINLSGTQLLNKTNFSTVAIYPTGKSVVYNTTLAALTIRDNGGALATDLTVAFKGYNNDKAMNYGAAAGGPGNEEVDQLLDNIYGSDYTTYVDPVAGTPVTTAAEAEAATYGKYGNDAIRAIDQTGDGYIDYIFISEIFYGQVKSINEITLHVGTAGPSTASFQLEDIEFEGGVMPEVGDVLAFNVNYDIDPDGVTTARILPVETGKTVTKWGTTATHSTETNVSSVTYDGSLFNVAMAQINAISRKHSVFYMDGSYVVLSESSKSSTPIPASVANIGVVTKISGYSANTVTAVGTAMSTAGAAIGPMQQSSGMEAGNWGFSISYMKLDGTTGTRPYSYADHTYEFGYAITTMFNSATTSVNVAASKTDQGSIVLWSLVRNTLQLGNGAGADGARSNATVAASDVQFVVIIENADGTVTLRPADQAAYFQYSNIASTHAYADNDNTYDASYSTTDNILRYNGTGKAYITDDTLVMFRYDCTFGSGAALSTGNATGKFKAMTGADLLTFSSSGTTRYYVEAVIDNSINGTCQAVYIVTNGSIPTAPMTQWAIITGDRYQTLDDDGYARDAANGINADNESVVILNEIGQAVTKWALVKFIPGEPIGDGPVSSVNATGIVKSTEIETGYITLVESDYMMFNGKRVNFTTGMAVFKITGTSVTAVDAPFIAGAAGTNNVGVVLDGNGNALAVVINTSTAQNVRTNNTAGVAITTALAQANFKLGGHSTQGTSWDTNYTTTTLTANNWLNVFRDGETNANKSATKGLLDGYFNSTFGAGYTLTWTLSATGNAAGAPAGTASIVDATQAAGGEYVLSGHSQDANGAPLEIRLGAGAITTARLTVVLTADKYTGSLTIILDDSTT